MKTNDNAVQQNSTTPQAITLLRKGEAGIMGA